MKWFLIAALFLSTACFAQQAGFRDLTASWRAPDDHIPSPSPATCPTVHRTISHGHPSQPAAVQEKIELTITETSPARLRVGEDFVVTVRLKNLGAEKVLIPWQPDGEQVARISPDGTEEKFEVADVSLRLASGKKRDIAIPLETEGALFAHPDDPAAYFQIDPGKWVDVKLKAAVVCGLDDCRSEVQADEHAALTAWWYQRVLTHHVKDCDEDHGVSKIREVDSSPLIVAVRAAEAPAQKIPGKDKPSHPAPNPNIASDRLLAGFQY